MNRIFLLLFVLCMSCSDIHKTAEGESNNADEFEQQKENAKLFDKRINDAKKNYSGWSYRKLIYETKWMLGMDGSKSNMPYLHLYVNRALSINPTNEAKRLKYKLWIYSCEYDSAIKIMQKNIDILDTNRVMYYLYYAFPYELSKRFDSAQYYYKKALHENEQLHGKNGINDELLTCLIERLIDSVRGIQCIDSLSNLNPEDKTVLYIQDVIRRKTRKELIDGMIE